MGDIAYSSTISIKNLKMVGLRWNLTPYFRVTERRYSCDFRTTVLVSHFDSDSLDLVSVGQVLTVDFFFLGFGGQKGQISL